MHMQMVHTPTRPGYLHPGSKVAALTDARIETELMRAGALDLLAGIDTCVVQGILVDSVTDLGRQAQ